jgi:hypothetical protein
MALDATIGGATSNSYVTVAQADAYFATRANASGWAGTNDTKERALITATLRLDPEPWLGSRATEEQALRWPRFGVNDLDGYSYDEDEIPLPLQYATFELALTLLSSDILVPSGLEGFDEVKLGPLQVKIRQVLEGELPETVVRHLQGLADIGISGSGGSTFRMLRG